jgi:hypothetical protein
VALRRLCRWPAAAVLALGAAMLGRGAEPLSILPAGLKPAAGAPVDVAPWGERHSWEQGKDVGLFWEDARDVQRVVVTFEGNAPDPARVRLQWWQSGWPERRIPRDRLSGAGESGWLDIGDWYKGRWRDADAALDTAGNTWTYTFHPVNAREFPNLKEFAAAYRSTLKLRLLADGPAPALQSLRAYTDSTWQATEVAVEWGGTAQTNQVWDGRLEVFNGYAEQLAPLNPEGGVTLSPEGGWKSAVQGRTAGIRARVWHTASPNINTFDKTIVTVRARQHSFSFDAGEVAGRARVFAPFYGVMVRRADDPFSYAEALAQWKNRTAKPIYEAVFDEPEQTYARAWAEMPPRKRFYIPLGCEGGRQRFGVDPDGSVFCLNDRIDQPRGKDTARRTWGGNRLRYSFGLPGGGANKRWIEDGCLPIIHGEWERDGVRYTQTALATRLEPGRLGPPDMQADDTTVLVVRIMAENTGNDTAPAAATLALQVDGRPLELSTRDGMVYARLERGETLRAAIEIPEGANVSTSEGKITCSGELPPNGTAAVVIKIPFITLDQPAELERLRNMSFHEEFKRVRGFWRGRADASTQIWTPVTEITSFYRADVSHLLINCGREVGSDRLMARVGSFAYGVYGNESCMMITDLDRRGLHKEAEQCLETFLEYQGSTGLPGDYASREGVFNGANGWESGGYNQHHGWILWAMAEHYWYSGDAAWLKRSAPKLVKACRWIINERSRTKGFDPASLRGIERGLLSPGSLEDIGDWRSWLSNNGFSWWGLDSVARAFTHAGIAEGQALQVEAEAYRADLLTAFGEAKVRSPLVRLRDGRYIPQIPSEVHRRGRTFGWITTTLEGAIYLIRTGAIAPTDPIADLIMQDYEDNLYLSDQYGYSPKHMQFWFSRGGFSMQPNLLCSPHPYLMRDEIKHFLRSYFNAYAASYYPDTKMMTEHPLPDLGDQRGDHYKSSDESNSTYWLRLMFVDERADDLYLGMAVPRAWLADGAAPAIERAATYFGPMSLRFESHANKGSITAVLAPPTRRPPHATFLRFRHPLSKPIVRVTVNEQPWNKFDPKREWVELPNLAAPATIVAYFGE